MPKDDKRDLAEVRVRLRKWLRYYQETHDLSNADLARSLGFSNATISNLIRDLEEPGFDFIVRMHTRLGANLAEVIRFDPPTKVAAPAGLPRK